MQEEVKHYKVKSLPTILRPNSVYYVKATSQSAVKTYITDQIGFAFPLIDLNSTVQTVTGTGVTGTASNPIVNISTFKSSQLGNLIELSTNDGKLFVKPIISPDGSIDIVSTATSLELQLGSSLQTQIQNALQPGNNISELVNDVGYITLADIPFSAVSATAWTPNHTVATGNPYLAGTIVYYQGHIFQANFNNDSIVPVIGGNLYWTDLGVGYLIDQEQTDWLAVSGSAFIKNKPTNVSSFINDAGYLTSFTETDPVFSAWISTNPLSGYATQSWVNSNFYPSSNPNGYITAASLPTQYLDTALIDTYIGNRLKPLDPTSNGFFFRKSINGAIGYVAVNHSSGNGAVATTGVGIDPTDNYNNSTYIAHFGVNYYIPQFAGNGALLSTKSLFIGTYGVGDIDFVTGSTYLTTSSRFKILNNGQLQIVTTPTTGTTSDFLLLRDTLGNVKQIAYPSIPAGGLPPGGTSGQILTKVDATDYNATWQDNYADWTSVVKHVVKNDGTALITKGTPVYVTGADGTNMLVRAASNTSEATSSKTMGLMQSDITLTGATQTGFVIAEGLLGGLNTAGTTAGDPVWLGAGGTLLYGLINKPYAPNHLVFIGIVTKVSAGNGEIFVKIQNGFELNEIHDIDLKTNIPVNGEVLGFDGTLWVNKKVASWLGYEPMSDLQVRRKGYIFFDDFFINTGVPFVRAFILGGTGGLSSTSMGVYRINSGANANSGGSVLFANSGLISTVGLIDGLRYDAYLLFPTLDSLSTIRIGFIGGTNNQVDAVNGMYFEVNGATIVGKTANTNVRSTTSGYTLSIATSYHLRITYLTTSVLYEIYNPSGTLLWSASLTTNMPTSTLNCGLIATNSGIVTRTLVDIDYIGMTIPPLNRGALT